MIVGHERWRKPEGCWVDTCRCDPTNISLQAACQLFQRHVAKTSAIAEGDFATLKGHLIQRGDAFTEISINARQRIGKLGARFVSPGSTVLIHGFPRVVLCILQEALNKGVQMNVVLTEGRPDGTYQNMVSWLHERSIPTTVILDSGVAHRMERVDMVLVGAAGVVENGGVISKLGTFQIALCARALNKPFYVAAEAYKFARRYPLNQRDLPIENAPIDFGPLLPSGVKVENPTQDYTPPEYISLLFTDLGVLTPAAVSDELIQLYM
ncbi:unnamed protein product [Ostreobium quekettii]|uniref:Translation initiation factor eIF2B subunit alpha n=1 Tax=Ostreobium quekettii TaxID=121088 RepID=A0A8S1JAK5_9CHLO|nr:unnamed protein product [Ostreobium quekettii]